jgi:hypothetical protein
VRTTLGSTFNDSKCLAQIPDLVAPGWYQWVIVSCNNARKQDRARVWDRRFETNDEEGDKIRAIETCIDAGEQEPGIFPSPTMEAQIRLGETLMVERTGIV